MLISGGSSSSSICIIISSIIVVVVVVYEVFLTLVPNLAKRLARRAPEVRASLGSEGCGTRHDTVCSHISVSLGERKRRGRERRAAGPRHG